MGALGGSTASPYKGRRCQVVRGLHPDGGSVSEDVPAPVCYFWVTFFRLRKTSSSSSSLLKPSWCIFTILCIPLGAGAPCAVPVQCPPTRTLPAPSQHPPTHPSPSQCPQPLILLQAARGGSHELSPGTAGAGRKQDVLFSLVAVGT